MSRSRHLMTLASAGSGKTYALTSRFIELLAQGAHPDRIAALTFTRKSAGEFFDAILKKLAAAAGSPSDAADLAKEIGRPGSDTAYFLGLLRTTIVAMPRLRLGTLDGFFARIVRAFPMELGLAGDFELLEGSAVQLERRRVFRRMFLVGPGGLNPAQLDFVEAFKRATFGRDEKRLSKSVDEYLNANQEVYLDAPDGSVWGNPTRIWPGGVPWADAPPHPKAAIAVLEKWLEGAGATDKQRRRWTKFFEQVVAWSPGASVSGDLKYILNKALPIRRELLAGPTEMKVEQRAQKLPLDAARALAAVASYLLGAELTRRLEVTRGLHQVVGAYEASYHVAVRRGGKLTFGDVQRLLEPTRLGSGAADAEETAQGRLVIDYRLDGEVDHWLFDEFQDTSFGQWTILRNLIDEVVQDPAATRSFFCVGDVKQAIYGWRRGDRHLFRQILGHYNAAAPDTISEQHLDVSYRSAPPVIELVNAVFGAASVFSDLFPGATADAWNSEWREHTTAHSQRAGQACLLHAADPAARWQLTLDLILQIAPLDRGLTCAVLVQKNATGSEIADFLRGQGGLPAVADADLSPCTDNPLGQALLALLRAAAHPGDRLAWEHVRMSPLGAILVREGLERPDALSARLLGELHTVGFEATLAAWFRWLEPSLAPADDFSRERARQITAAAGAFDATGNRVVDDFIEFMDGYTTREAESARVIRVMTIHKAKGLDFDVVIVPDLAGQTLALRRDGLGVRRAPDRSVEWILDLPTQLFCDADPVLSSLVADDEAEACYEKLALLYVALTRAKRGLYVITEPVGNSSSHNFPRLLANTLGDSSSPIRVGDLTRMGPWMRGDPFWFRKMQLAPASAPRAPFVPIAAAPAGPRLVSRQPSTERSEVATAARLFAFERNREADFGARVHALLAEVEWAGAAERSRRAQLWTEQAGAPGYEAAECLRSRELTGVWERPPGEAVELWRERAFEVVVGDSWVSGVFDRVLVHRDATGQARAATLFDFKTDRVDPRADLSALAARHAGQLGWYRQAIQFLTGLPAESIRCELVYTRTRQRIPIGAG